MSEKCEKDDTKLHCAQCQKEIPHSVAHTVEGSGYILHFCCENCRKHYFEEHPELATPGN